MTLIEVRARLIHTSARRLYVSVHVASSDVRTGVGGVAAHAMALFAALDDDGGAMSVRQWSPVTEEDRRLDRHALELVEVLHRGSP